MPDLRLVPAAGCDCCGKTAEVVVLTLAMDEDTDVWLCHDCTRAIIKKFQKGDGHYG